MTDVGFVIAGYTVILGGLATYAVTLLLRLRARRTEADQAPSTSEPDVPGPPAAG